MKKIRFLNSREIKKIIQYLSDNYGADLDMLKKFAYHENNLGRIFIVSRDIDMIDLENIRAQIVGLYFGERVRDAVRLSIWGSEIVGKYASKNIIDLSEDEARDYFKGKNIDISLGEKSRWIISRYKRVFLGSAAYSKKKIFNYLPKEHRTENILLV